MSRYATACANPQGPGDARPTALQIVHHEGLTGKLTDKVFLVTGVSSGIGIETMRALYATGGHVYGTVRNAEKGQKVVDEIKATTTGGQITLIEMELDSLASIKKGVEAFLAQSKTLNVLVNNAGIMACPESKTKDGFEAQFGTNHLGHFYLFQLLKPTLLHSASSTFPSRVVSVSSMGHRFATPRFLDGDGDYTFSAPDHSYEPWTAYAYAKTANIYFANELDRRYGAQHLHATSLHPGGIRTGLQVHVDPEMMAGWLNGADTKKVFKSPAQGAATSVYAAVSEEWKAQGGKYLNNCVVEIPMREGNRPWDTMDEGHATWAYDEAREKKLWQHSLKMVGLQDDL